LKVIAKKGDVEEVKAQERDIVREVEAMVLINHVNVVRLFGVDWNAEFPTDEGLQPSFVIAMELAKGGVFFDLLFRSANLEAPVARAFFQQIVDGLEACHAAGVAHRDLKPENLLLDENLTIKLTDFGLSSIHREQDIQHLMETQCGTLSYLAPEVIKGKQYGYAADIFSLGVVLFVLVTKLMPFEYATGKDWWYNKIRTQKYDMFWLAHEKSAETEFDADFKQLVLSMLSPEPVDRPTIEQIRSSRWFSAETFPRDELSSVFVKKTKTGTLRRMAKKMGLAAEERSVDVLELDENGLPISLAVQPVFGKARFVEDDDVFASYADDAQEVVPPQYTGDIVSYTQFHSNAKASTIVNTMANLLATARCKYNQTTFGLGFEIMFPNGELIDASMEIYQHNDLRLVQFRRRNGDMILFNEIYDQIVDSLSELVVE